MSNTESDEAHTSSYEPCTRSATQEDITTNTLVHCSFVELDSWNVDRGDSKSPVLKDHEQSQVASGQTTAVASHTGLKLTDQTNLLPFRRVVSVFAGLAVCIVVSTLDMTLVATALPSLSSEFNAGAFLSSYFSQKSSDKISQDLFLPSFHPHICSHQPPSSHYTDASRTYSAGRWRCVWLCACS